MDDAVAASDLQPWEWYEIDLGSFGKRTLMLRSREHDLFADDGSFFLKFCDPSIPRESLHIGLPPTGKCSHTFRVAPRPLDRFPSRWAVDSVTATCDGDTYRAHYRGVGPDGRLRIELEPIPMASEHITIGRAFLGVAFAPEPDPLRAVRDVVEGRP